MSPLAPLKAILVTISAGCGAIVVNSYFSVEARAYAGVIGAASGGLLAYILNPKGGPPSSPAPVTVVNTPDQAVPTNPQS